MNADEVKAFQFFQEQSAEYLAKHSYRPFWLTTVPKVCWSNSIIKSLVIAIATFHRIEGPSPVTNTLRERQLFYAHYHKALNMTAQTSEADLGVVVVGISPQAYFVTGD